MRKLLSWAISATVVVWLSGAALGATPRAGIGQGQSASHAKSSKAQMGKSGEKGNKPDEKGLDNAGEKANEQGMEHGISKAGDKQAEKELKKEGKGHKGKKLAKGKDKNNDNKGQSKKPR